MTQKLAQLSMGMNDATVVEVLVRVGQEVTEGAALLVVETDKVEVEIASAVNGVVSGIFVEPDMDVQVGDPLVQFAREPSITQERS